MNPILENPVDEIRRIKAALAVEDGYDSNRMAESLRKLEAELRAQGRIFADNITAGSPPPPPPANPAVLREDPTKLL